MKRKVLIGKRVYIKGAGFRDMIYRIKDGIKTPVKYQILNGVKKLVPIAIGGLKTVANSGLDKLTEVLQDKVESYQGNSIVPIVRQTQGKSIARPVNNRQVILQEISKHLGKKTTGGMIRAY